MATIDTLPAMLDETEDIARGQMAEFGIVAPMVFCQKSNGEKFFIAYEPAPTATQRRLVALAIGKQLREWDIVTYVVVNEVWTATTDRGEPLVKPSESPDRIEAVFLQAHNITTVEHRILRIDRTGPKPQLVPLDEMEGAKAAPGGTWDGLLQPPGEQTH